MLFNNDTLIFFAKSYRRKRNTYVTNNILFVFSHICCIKNKFIDNKIDPERKLLLIFNFFF